MSMNRERILKTEFSESFIDLILSTLKDEFNVTLEYKIVLNNKEKFNDFIEKMRKRMVISYYKYGSIKDNYSKKLVNCIKSLERRQAKYLDTGNAEFLIDIANFSMIEFMYPQSNGHYYEDNIILNGDLIEHYKNLIEHYKMSKNTKCMVYIAIKAIQEFLNPTHNNAYFKATDSGESPGLVGTTIKEIEQASTDAFYHNS